MMRILTLTLTLFLLLGCGDDKNKEPSVTKSTPIVVIDEDTLTSKVLQFVDNTNSFEDFSDNALASILDYAIETYVPSFLQSYVKDSDLLSLQTLLTNPLIVDALRDFYTQDNSNNSKSTQYALAKTAQETLLDIVTAILGEIKNLIWDFLGFDSKDNNESNDSEGNYTVDPNAPVGFSIEMLQGKTFYVISSVADMEVEMNADGLSGSGAMGFISMDFTDFVDADLKLQMQTSLMGDFTMEMTYRDPNYCIASKAIQLSTGEVFESYWFSNEEETDNAGSVREAKALCHIHSAEFNDTAVTIDEGEITPIDDIRDGHTPQTAQGTENVVDALFDIETVASYTDAKYFVRQLRHGPFSIYTTNEQDHTLQAKETENVLRELMPLGISSGLNMKTLLTDAFDISLAFQEEIDKDLNGTFNAMNPRLTALANAANVAMQNTMDSASISSGGYGASTSSYGDKVEFRITNMDTNICLVFFLCESSVSADVFMKVSNAGTQGNTANILFQTRINATSMDINSVNFSQVDSPAGQVNKITGNGYDLDITYFRFHRGSGTLDLKGSGSIEELGNVTPRTKVVLSSYSTRVFLAEQGTLNFVFRSINAALQGTISTKAGKTFDGTLYFDGFDTKSNEMNGTLTDNVSNINIVGNVKSSLSFNDIDTWINGHNPVGVDNGVPYFVNEDGSFELVSRFSELTRGRYEALTFERSNNRFDCEKVQDGEYTCTDFLKENTKTLKFTTTDELLKIDTNNGEYYILGIKNVFSYSLTELIMMKIETRKVITLSEYRTADAEISNVRIASSDINGPVDINDLGDQSYIVNAKISKENQSFSADMKMSRDDSENTWTFNIFDLDVNDEYGRIKAKEINVIQSGDNKLVEFATDLIAGGQTLDLDINGVLNLGWDAIEGFDYIDMVDFEIMLTASNGDAKIKNTMHIVNQETNIKADFNASYDYGNTHVSGTTDVDVAVTTNTESTTYSNVLSAQGIVQAESIEDYAYALDFEDNKQSLLFTRQDTGYQMGFKFDENSITGADSYGVKSFFDMNDALSVVNGFEVKDINQTPLGSYTKETDPLKVYYTDDTTEYLYLY